MGWIECHGGDHSKECNCTKWNVSTHQILRPVSALPNPNKCCACQTAMAPAELPSVQSGLKLPRWPAMCFEVTSMWAAIGNVQFMRKWVITSILAVDVNRQDVRRQENNFQCFRVVMMKKSPVVKWRNLWPRHWLQVCHSHVFCTLHSGVFFVPLTAGEKFLQFDSGVLWGFRLCLMWNARTCEMKCKFTFLRYVICGVSASVLTVCRGDFICNVETEVQITCLFTLICFVRGCQQGEVIQL